MALFAAQDPNQWATSPHFGYDNTGLLTTMAAQGLAPAALLQASNFRVSSLKVFTRTR